MSALGGLRGVVRGSLRAFSSAAAERRAGKLYICGTGESNKLGLGDTRDREVPVPIEALLEEDIVHVSIDKYHSMAVSASGDVFAWGLEASGQLGLGSHRTKAPTPTKVEALSGIGVTAISCGMYHTLALTDAGEVWSVGFGGSFLGGAGGLGHGDRKQLATPEKIAAFGEDGVRAASVSAGGYHSVVLDTDGGVWSWGRGEWGRLGHNDSSDLLTPTRLEACDEMGVGTALAGEAHSACLGRDGSVHTWGRNEHWQV